MCKDLIPSAAVSCIPQLKERSVSHPGKATVPRRRGENSFQLVPLSGLINFPAVEIQVGDTSVPLNMLEGVKKMALPIGSAIVGVQEI